MANAAPPETVRILTYNIHHAEGTDEKLDLGRIAGVIRAAQPDIVCLQEVDRNLPRTDKRDLVAELEALLEMKGVFGANLQWLGGEYGVATFSRWPIAEHENTPLPGPEDREPRGALYTRIDTPGGPLAVWNTHWGLEAEERAEQGRFLARRLGQTRTVVCGDFNEREGSEGLEHVRQALQMEPPPPLAPSFPSTKPSRRIDHILATTDVAILALEVRSAPPADVASDHLPVFAELRLTE